MTQAVGVMIGALRTELNGPVIGAADPDYDEARRLWNADIDLHPTMITKCESAGDVSAAVTFAVEHGLEIAVRAGSHSISGDSSVDDGLMIDLSRLNRVSVDAKAKRARVGGGALLSDLDAATQKHGLATPAGMISHTGVAGLTLGGGMGWLTRKAGLSIDNLESAEVVTADGQIRRASAEENADLFWAIRGGGGNFGVVTEFEFRLHELNPVVQLGILFWGIEQGPDVLRVARQVTTDMPPDVNILIAGLNAPPAPFVPEVHRLQPGYALVVVGFGSVDVHDRVVARIREALPPLWESVTPTPYTALQQLLDEANAWGFHSYDKATYISDLSEEAIAVITDHMRRKSSPLSVLLFYRLDQAYSEVGEDDTAFGGGRSPRYSAFIIAICPTPELLVADREWVRSFWEALRPYSLGAGSYVNANTEFEEDRVRASYGPEKYERLARLKAKYDPRNVFHRNANIQPATSVHR